MEFFAVFILFPFLSLLSGIAGQLLFKRPLLVVGLVCLVWLIATFVVFNESFLIWVGVYTVLAGIGVGVVYWLQMRGKG